MNRQNSSGSNLDSESSQWNGLLTLKPRHDAYWMLFTRRHMVLTFRGDKMFSYRKSDADPNTKKWKAAWHPRGM